MIVARAHKHIDVRVSPAQFFEVISDYEAYPQIIPEMENAVIERRAGDVVEGVFTINLIKRVSYTLRLMKKAPRRLSWSLVEGPFKTNVGCWTLDEIQPGRTRAQYEVEVTVGLFVPQRIVTGLVERSLPALLQAFKAEAERRFDTV